MACSIDREPLLVQQVADAPDEQHFVMLVVAPVAAALYRLELRELLLPVAEHVRLDRAQLADFANGEVALGGDRREGGASLPGLGHGLQLRPLPSIFDSREKSPRGER